ncbi:hypothetical protein C8J57DRAFT_1508624 [Mycena rebaudengoi]|nr:hypothetical protein C8J57DRAFT_1508624 [Mycena rebaudengoi]
MPPTAANSPANLAPRPATTPTTNHTNTDDTHTCFKCGVQGHICTNPICAKYNEPSVPRPRVSAQRVLESYADGEWDLDDEEELLGEDHDGLWGGDQYKPNDDDPNIAPNLDALLGRDEEVLRVV